MEELFTVLEVAERLKVPQRTVKRWLLSGQLRGLKAGRKWRVKPSAIEAFLQASKDIGQAKSGAESPSTNHHEGSVQ
jgi:excisionase family DNA binding protein